MKLLFQSDFFKVNYLINIMKPSISDTNSNEFKLQIMNDDILVV